MTGGDGFEVPSRGVTRRVRDELVIVDLESGTYFGREALERDIADLVVAHVERRLIEARR